MIDVTQTGLSAQHVNKALLARGVRMGAIGPETLRAVTHLDISSRQVAEAAEIFADLVAE